MTDYIVPPPELVQQWAHEWNTLGVRHPDATNTASYVATRAAQWGADQELEACCEWTQGYAECGDSLRRQTPQAAELEGAGAGNLAKAF